MYLSVLVLVMELNLVDLNDFFLLCLILKNFYCGQRKVVYASIMAVSLMAIYIGRWFGQLIFFSVTRVSWLSLNIVCLCDNFCILQFF